MATPIHHPSKPSIVPLSIVFFVGAVMAIIALVGSVRTGEAGIVFVNGLGLSLLLGVSVYLARSVALRRHEAREAAATLRAEKWQRRSLEEEIKRRESAESLQRELQEQLAQQVKELARRNDELDNYARAVSHDLKAPLRSIDQISQWLVEDLGRDLPGESKKHLEVMRSRVRRMENLLDDMLSYARFDARGDTRQCIDLGQLCRDVVETLGLPEGYTVRVIEPMPTIHAHRVPLQQVLHNLVSNAVKHHDRNTGEIRIEARDRIRGQGHDV
jgi:signal transduction histidine kinase